MSILSGAIGTMKKKGPSWAQYQVPGTYNSKTYWVTGKGSEPAGGTAGLEWGSDGVLRNTIDLDDGLANSTTLAGFGQAAHPAAYYCRNLTLGGYSWFLPARNELNHIYVNISATGKLLSPAGSHPDKFSAAVYWSSSEDTADYSRRQDMNTGAMLLGGKYSIYRVRACRKV